MNSSIPSLISQKRESFRVNIRKIHHDDYFNSKRFSVLSSTTSTKMSVPLELESDPFSPAFIESLSEALSSHDLSSSSPSIADLSVHLKGLSLLIEKKAWFDSDLIEKLLFYCFRYMDSLDDKVLVDFCFFLEKLCMFCPIYYDKLVSMRIVEKMKSLLQTHRKSRDITESVFFCFTQISSNPEYIELLMKNDIVLEILITLLLDKSSLVLVKMISWLTYNMTTGVPDFKPYYSYGKFLFTICAQMLEISSKEVVTCNLASIYYLINEDKLDDFCFNKDFLINDKIHILEFVNKCYRNNDDDIKIGALKIAYKVSLGKEKHAELLIEKGLIKSIIGLLREKSEKIQTDSLVIIGNAVDTPKHLDHCLQNGLLEELFEVFMGNSTLNLKKECVLCLAQCTMSLTEGHWLVFVKEARVLELFCEALDIFGESEVIKLSLSGIQNVLACAGEDEEKIRFCKIVLEGQGFDKIIEKMTGHHEGEVSLKAMELANMIKF